MVACLSKNPSIIRILYKFGLMFLRSVLRVRSKVSLLTSRFMQRFIMKDLRASMTLGAVGVNKKILAFATALTLTIQLVLPGIGFTVAD